MDWIHEFQLFLFDFDGLLVDTEQFHFQAYQRMCAGRGFHLDWTFEKYASIALHSAEGLKNEVYASFPALQKMEPNWKVLYEEKRQAILQLFREKPIPLMEGVEELLEALARANIPRCVVTHSGQELVSSIRKKNPILDTIPHWITREHYSHAKPNPECYQLAISQLANESDKIIGFEDSIRGLEALLGTKAKPVLICPAEATYVEDAIKRGATHYTSFKNI